LIAGEGENHQDGEAGHMRVPPTDDHVILFGNSCVEKPRADPVLKMIESFGVVLVERHQRPGHAL
jgi:hypothetical protein